VSSYELYDIRDLEATACQWAAPAWVAHVYSYYKSSIHWHAMNSPERKNWTKRFDYLGNRRKAFLKNRTVTVLDF